MGNLFCLAHLCGNASWYTSAFCIIITHMGGEQADTWKLKLGLLQLLAPLDGLPL